MDLSKPLTTIGLLTTITQLPLRFVQQKCVADSPLDLSIKASSVAVKAPQILVPALITPPSTPSPLKKRYREFNEEQENIAAKAARVETPRQQPVAKSNPPKSSKAAPSPIRERRTKASRKLKFDDETTSPVSGTIIKPLEEIEADGPHESGDIDPQYNIVEATPEARAEIAAIPNVIGDYRCRLCRIEFEDVFDLARHRCSCIVLLEYRCPECGKKFNCPANLASHRRWHKPRDQVVKKGDTTDEEKNFGCNECGKLFKRATYLRKHKLTHKDRKTSLPAPITSSCGEDSSSSAFSNNNNNNHKMILSFKQEMMDMDDDDYSRSSSPGRLQIVTDEFTEDENIAAAALAHLRNASVIKHTHQASALVM